MIPGYIALHNDLQMNLEVFSFMAIETVTRIKLVLSQAEYRALMAAASRTLRTPEAEARFIIRRELHRLALLPDNAIPAIEHGRLDNGELSHE